MHVSESPTAGNTLFPIFVKFEQFRVLIVGAGNVGLEKAGAILNNSPATQLTIIGARVLPELREFTAHYPNTQIIQKYFEPGDLDGQQFAIICTDDPPLNRDIKQRCAERGLLANVADTPDFCDFYLGSIVQKGDLKIAISTNGKSPTMAKRLKEMLHEALPDETDALLQNMRTIRSRLTGDFAEKIRVLNRVTDSLVAQPEAVTDVRDGRNWKRVAQFSLTAFILLVLANVVFITGAHQQLEPQFWAYLGIGFMAQLVDGLLGMGYGVTSAMGLMTMNVPAAAISSSIHTAEMFAAGASGYSHYRFGNVRRQLFQKLLIPGVLGAIGGALLLSWLDGQEAKWLRPFLAVYTLLLGIRILRRAFREHTNVKAVRRIGLLAGMGGFLDSFSGGGWGPLVNGTLIAKGQTPKEVIGSVSLAEFFVTLASAITFFAAIGIGHWQVVMGLTFGGVAAAPLAARLAGKLPAKTMFIGVGVMIIFWSIQIFVKAFL